MNQTPPAPPRKYPPLTPAQQRQVLAYRKIATDYARRLIISYERLISGDEAESIGMLALCQAAQRFDSSRASNIWALAKLRIRQRVFEAIHDEMRRASGARSLSAILKPIVADEVELRARRGLRGARGVVLEKLTVPSVSDEDRHALRVIADWASEDPTRAETIDRAVVGDDLTPADLDRLESLRLVLGLPSPEAVSVADAAQRMGRTPKELRAALTRGTVPGFRCGASWRVYLGAALRCAT